MSPHRHPLPQLDSSRLFLTDGGLETTLIFREGWDLPAFAAFTLLETPAGEAALRRYYTRYLDISAQHHAGFILESPTWRASADWGRQLGYSAAALATANRRAIALLEDLRRREAQRFSSPLVISGCVGPRGDGYVPGARMSSAEAEQYHRAQIATFAGTAADMITAVTMNYPEEAIGIARAAQRAGLPCAISFTLETDGRLPTGESLRAAIARVEDATAAYPAYYMINCAHPAHFAHVLDGLGPYARRIRGLRANASCRSHAELNEASELDAGDPQALAWAHVPLLVTLPRLNVLGGCCGTDERHVDALAATCGPLFTALDERAGSHATLLAGSATFGLAGLAFSLLMTALLHAA